jgi:peptidoglycan/LPS O-acetylase OafA/YrhL
MTNLPPHGALPAQDAGFSLRAIPAWLGRPVADDDLRHNGNIFNLLRLVLASAVIFSHSFDVVGLTGQDPSLDVLPFPVSRLAVLLFFTLSGFLVTPGLMRRGFKSFVVARGLRLLPGLWAMLLVTTAVVMLFFTAVPMGQNSGLFNYLVRNLLLLQGGYVINGAFADQPMAQAVNGSLWTISREVQCYLILAGLGWAGVLAKRRLMLALWLGGMVLHMTVPFDLIPALQQLRWLSLSFFAGVLLYLWHDRLWLSWPLLLGLTGLALMVERGPWARLAVAMAAAYALIAVAMLVPTWLKRLSARMPDYSYGIYIYAFPAQQVAYALDLGRTPYSNMISGFLLALPFAMLSWHLVEKPALARKPSGNRSKSPAQPATPPA